MNRFRKKSVASQVLILMLGSVFAAQASSNTTPTVEDLWALVQAQQKEIERLKTQQKTTEEKVEATAEASAEMADEVAAQRVASAKPSWADKTRFGGYGELHYNNLDSKNEIDLHRFVLEFSHDFSDKVRFVSELEVEHGGVEADGDPLNGELEVEQAYVEFDFADKHAARAGVFLVPVGIINETHEPTTFYGVERNPVENNIIPATWWEGGAGVSGELAPGWKYDLALTSGLETATTGSNAYKIRNGRQKTSFAKANDGAFAGRLKWAGVPGVELAATAQYQSDLTQGTGAAGTSSSATLFETHAVLNRGPVGMRALYARWDLSGTGPAATGRDKQNGWYVEPSYKLTSNVGVFARYNQWDNNAGSGSTSNTKIKQVDVGMNFWPHEDVVLKLDVQKQSGAANDDGFNMGVGYQF